MSGVLDMMLDIILLNLINTNKVLYSSPLQKEGMKQITLFLLLGQILQGNQKQPSFGSSFPMCLFIWTVWLHFLQLEIQIFSKITEVILRYLFFRTEVLCFSWHRFIIVRRKGVDIQSNRLKLVLSYLQVPCCRIMFSNLSLYLQVRISAFVSFATERLAALVKKTLSRFNTERK